MGADGELVSHGEQRTGWSSQTQQPDGGRLGALDARKIELDQSVVHIDVVFIELVSVDLVATLTHGARLQIAQVPDRAMTVGDQMAQALPNTSSEVGDYAVGINGRGVSVHEYNRGSPLTLAR